MGVEVSHRNGEGAKVLSKLKSVWKERSLFVCVWVVIYNGIMVLMYGCEAWAPNKKYRTVWMRWI